MAKHTLKRTGNTYRYGPWHIADAGWLRPSPSVQTDWWHEDYDGADGGDGRCGSAATIAECVAAIDEWEADNEQA